MCDLNCQESLVMRSELALLTRSKMEKKKRVLDWFTSCSIEGLSFFLLTLFFFKEAQREVEGMK